MRSFSGSGHRLRVACLSTMLGTLSMGAALGGCGAGGCGGGRGDDEARRAPSVGPESSREGEGLSSWRHPERIEEMELDEPEHVVFDAVTNPGVGVTVIGKFAYGTRSRDLEGEAIEVTRDRDGAVVVLGTAVTDDNGEVSIALDASEIVAAGRFEVTMRVVGDDSRGRGWVHVLPRGAAVVIFDIDGTLTEGDGDLLRLAASQTPRIRAGAMQLLNHYVEAGLTPFYLTGRHYALATHTRAWLIEQGLPPGPLWFTHTLPDSTPMAAGVQRFKQAALMEWRIGLGLDVRHAYGNAPTDICAYAGAQIPPSETFIIGNHGGEACEGYGATQAVTSYAQHLATLVSTPRLQTLDRLRFR